MARKNSEGFPFGRCIVVPILVYIILSIQFELTKQASDSDGSSSKNVTNPFIYQRLRFDRDFLQIYRRYQKNLKMDEKKVKLRFNTSLYSAKDDSAKEVRFEYYSNNKVESSSITRDDLIFEALDRTYLTRLIPVFIFNYDKRQDMLKASDPTIVSRERCLRDLGFLTNQLNTLELARLDQRSQVIMLPESMSPELMAFYDSFAGEDPGVLLGNYHWTGNWRQCIKRRIFSLGEKEGKTERSRIPIEFKGRYCIASIRSKSWDEKIKQRSQELEERGHFKYPEQRNDYARFFRIQVGICLPDSCDSQAIEWEPQKVNELTMFKLAEPFKSYLLNDLYCLPDKTSELRRLEPSGKLFISLITIWSLLIICSTAWDYYSVKPEKSSSNLDKLISALSLIQNYKRLVETESCQPIRSVTGETVRAGQTGATKSGPTTRKPHPNDLLFLNSIKVVTMPMIIFGHVGMLFKHLDKFPLDYDGLDSDFVFHFQASTPFFVDWYFVISGFLTTYIMFATRKVETNSAFQWLYTIFHRYWRLAPLYILLFWFSQSVFMHTSSGPLWDYGTSNMTLRSICRQESWLWPLTMTSNLHPLHEECIMPAWYIACDMQFYLVTPLILILLHKSPLMGWLASIGAIGACISLRLHRYLTDRKAQPLELMRPRYDLYMRNNWDMHPTYVYPQYRIATYLIGILAGHYTIMVLSGKWSSIMCPRLNMAPETIKPKDTRKGHRSQPDNSKRSENIPRFLRLLTWIVGVHQLLAMMFSTWLISELFPVHLEDRVKYFTAVVYAFDHTVAGLGMALMLITFMLGQFPSLKLFMAHPNWTVMSRVNFIVYLSQVEWIYWLIQSSDRTVEMSTLEMMKIFLYLCGFVYLFSTICTIMFELPLAQLERNFIGSRIMSSRITNQSKTKDAETSQGTRLARQACETEARPVESAEMSRLMNSSDRFQKSVGRS